jgi:hypothetical protein
MLKSAITDLGVALNGTDDAVKERFGLGGVVRSKKQQEGGTKFNCQDLRMQLLSGSVLAIIFGMAYCGIDGKQIFSDIEQRYFPGSPECDEYSVKCRLSENLQFVIEIFMAKLKVDEALVFIKDPWAWMKGYTSLWYLKKAVDAGKVLIQTNFGLLPLCQILFLDKSVPEKKKKGQIETFFTKLFQKHPDLSFVEQQLFH